MILSGHVWKPRQARRKSVCSCKMMSADWERSGHSWSGRVDRGWHSLQTKTSLSLAWCNFWNAKQRATPAEGKSIKKKPAQMVRASGWALCLVFLSTNTIDRREWEHSHVERAPKKDGKKNTSQTVINHISDALAHSWGSEVNGDVK